jgi:hypothetical protein
MALGVEQIDGTAAQEVEIAVTGIRRREFPVASQIADLQHPG